MDERYLELKKEYLDLKAEHEVTKSSNKKLSTENSKLRAKLETPESIAKTETPTLPPAPTPTETQGGGKTEETTQGPHVIKSWHPRYCSDCGTENPGFKNEVACANCGISLGAEEDVKKEGFKVCPNCGRGKENGGGWRKI